MQGGDMLLNDYKFTIGDNRELFTIDQHPISYFTALSILVCMMSGDDANYLDWLYKYGIVNVFVFALLAFVVNILSTQIFVRTWRFNYGLQFADVVQDIFGRGQYLVRVVFIISLIFTAIIIQQCVGYNLRTIFVPLIGHSFITEHYPMYYLIIPIFIFPFMFVSRFVNLHIYFLIANLGMLVVLGVAIYYFVLYYKDNGFDPQKTFIIATKDFWGCVNIYSSFSTLFWGQPFLCAIAGTFSSTTQSHVISISVYSTIIVFVINIVISLFMHFTFWGSVGNDDALVYYEPNKTATIIGLVGSLLNNAITTCGYIYIASNRLVELFVHGVGRFTRFYASFVVYLLCCALQYYYTEKYEIYFDIIGTSCYLFIAYYIPPAVYLRAFKVKGVWGVISLIYLIFIICITVLLFMNKFRE